MRELKQGGLLSVVLPSYNEEASIPRAAERITQLLTAADIPFELLFVDDGSKDGSWAAIQTQAARFPQVRGVRFSRNFGKEAAIFAGDLYKMYQRFCESRGWKTTVLDSSPSEAGGFKSIEFKVEGDRVYSVMKYESGVHRVQRVPKTESQGRIQTSTATVAVLPEAEEIDVQINQSDLRIDTYCASGPGGQCVNTTYSAVRITHLPTNTVVQSQEQRSQIQNREVCMQMLRARLYEMELEKQQAELGAERQSQIGHGNRSEKIRTYNQPQDRVTDHRIGFNSTYNGVLLGDQLGTVIEALAAAERAEKLAQAV